MFLNWNQKLDAEKSISTDIAHINNKIASHMVERMQRPCNFNKVLNNFNYLPVQSQALFDVFIDGNIINEMYRNNGKKPLDNLVHSHFHPIL